MICILFFDELREHYTTSFYRWCVSVHLAGCFRHLNIAATGLDYDFRFAEIYSVVTVKPVTSSTPLAWHKIYQGYF